MKISRHQIWWVRRVWNWFEFHSVAEFYCLPIHISSINSFITKKMTCKWWWMSFGFTFLFVKNSTFTHYIKHTDTVDINTMQPIIEIQLNEIRHLACLLWGNVANIWQQHHYVWCFCFPILFECTLLFSWPLYMHSYILDKWLHVNHSVGDYQLL